MAKTFTGAGITATTISKFIGKKKKNLRQSARLKSSFERVTVRTGTTKTIATTTSRTPSATTPNGLPANEREKKGRKSKRRKKIARGGKGEIEEGGRGGAIGGKRRIKKLFSRCKHRIRSLAEGRRPNCFFEAIQLVQATLMVALTFYALVLSIWSAFLSRAPPPPSQPSRATVQLSTSSEILLLPQLSPTPQSLSPALPFTDSRPFFWLFFLFNGHFLANIFALFAMITSRPLNLCRYTAGAADHLLYLFFGDFLVLVWTVMVHLVQFKAGEHLHSISMSVLFFSPCAISLTRLLLTVTFVLHFNAQLFTGGRWKWIDGSRQLKGLKKGGKEKRGKEVGAA